MSLDAFHQLHPCALEAKQLISAEGREVEDPANCRYFSNCRACPEFAGIVSRALVLRLREEREAQAYHCSSKFLIMLQSSDLRGNQTQISLILKATE